MKFRRGFKTEANQYAREFRQELGLEPEDPLCPRKLADRLLIPIAALSDFRSVLPDAVHQLSANDPSAFSAATVFMGTRRLILFNDCHDPYRQNADIAHELAHSILGHPPCPPLNNYGCRNFAKKHEDEANWLGPALLVSEEAALRIAEKGVAVVEAAKNFSVSKPLMQMRLNVTAAYRRVRSVKRVR